MKLRRLSYSVLGVLWIAASLSVREAESSGFESLAADGEPLIGRFNADTGKVRAVFLASPT